MTLVRIRTHRLTLRQAWRYRLPLTRRWRWTCDTCPATDWRGHRTQDAAKSGMVRHIDERHTP